MLDELKKDIERKLHSLASYCTELRAFCTSADELILKREIEVNKATKEIIFSIENYHGKILEVNTHELLMDMNKELWKDFEHIATGTTKLRYLNEALLYLKGRSLLKGSTDNVHLL